MADARRVQHRRLPDPSSRPRRALGGMALAMLLALPAPGGAADSSGIHVEVGASADVTNEQFFEDAFLDTVALGRRLVSEPESRVAAVLAAAARGTRGDGRVQWEIAPEVSLGDRVLRGGLALSWRDRTGGDWRWSLTPRAEYRRDRTFDRDLEEARASARLAVERRFGDGDSRAGLGLSGDVLRTRGSGAEFLPDRHSVRAALSWERSPLTGPEWRVEAAAVAREFPDSADRDHRELQAAAEARWVGSAGTLGGAVDVSRRWTPADAPSTRDDFREVSSTMSATARGSDHVSAFLRARADLVDYDEEDSTFFGHLVVRLELGPEWESGGWTVRWGPRAEWLRSRVAAERYREFAGFAEVEWSGLGSWWTAGPAAGWRGYENLPPATPADPSLPALAEGRSSYSFLELDLAVDRPLFAGTRVRVAGAWRQEAHTDGLEDTRSLYFSSEVRRLF